MTDDIYGKLNLIRYNLLKFKSFDEICESTGLEKKELIEYIESINRFDKTNYFVNQEKANKIEYKKRKYEMHILNTNKNKVKLMFVSDKHIDHIDDRLGYINDVYEEAERRKVDYVFDLGDVLNGPAEKVHQPSKARTGTLEGSLLQLKDFHPNNLTTYFITGNHDIKFMNANECNIGKLIEKECKNFRFLDNLFTSININGMIINLSHGSIENKLISQVHLKKEFPFLTSNNPHIIMQGHFHRVFDPVLIKNTLLCQVPCLKAASSDTTNSKNMGVIFLTIFDISKHFEVEYEEVEFVETKKVLKKEISIQKTKIEY